MINIILIKYVSLPKNINKINIMEFIKYYYIRNAFVLKNITTFYMFIAVVLFMFRKGISQLFFHLFLLPCRVEE